MLELIPNENKTAIQFLFSDYFSDEQQFVTAFDLDEAMDIGKELVKLVKQTQKEKKDAQKDNAKGS